MTTTHHSDVLIVGAGPAGLSLAAFAAYSIPASYLWLLVTWGLHLRGKKAGTAKKKPARGTRKAAKD